MDDRHRLGARLWPAGCYFRVWAPHARQVSVVVQGGDHWDSAGPAAVTDLVRGADDHWTAVVPGVTAGALYRFRIVTADGSVIERLDPAARDVISSQLVRTDPLNRNASVVLTAAEYPFAPFVPPRFENYVIYQLHVGTFAGRGDDHDTEWATFAQVESKLGYVRELGFTCVELLPVHEYARDRSWGYNPATLFAPESSYGSPHDLRHFVDAAHRAGLAVVFDVVHNHLDKDDNVLWDYDGYDRDGGIYFEDGPETPWGRGPAWWKREVQEFYYQNARMYLEEYHADGLRYDATRYVDGAQLAKAVGRLRADFPDRYIVAEHLPDDPWVTHDGAFCATWASRVHHETQRALAGQDPVRKVRGTLGWHGYDHAWNLVTYTSGSHDDVGDQEEGNAENGLTNWDARHRYLVDQLGGRDDWTARAKCRLAWALNAAGPGNPMMFMGSECLQGAPHVTWGYWHDGHDRRGDHRFDWRIAGDELGIQMRRLVAACNAVRRDNPALRADSLDVVHEDDTNQVLGFVRRWRGNVVLAVANLGDRTFGDHGYGVATGGTTGRWTQVLCTQDAAFGGWDGAGNAFHEPETQPDGRVYLNLPKWSMVLLRRLE
jgi:1,4-alpha-glucan branching enzyme